MEYGYIIKLSNKNLYKEIQLPIESERLKIGMNIDCDVRLYKSAFFEKFELALTKNEGGWQIICSDNIYIDSGDVRKLVTKPLKHGDTFKIKYRESDNAVFQVEFLFDFDNENKNYDYKINISNKDSITIGGAANNDIVLNSEYTQHDLIELKLNSSGAIITERVSKFGVYKNGQRIKKQKENIKNCDFFSIGEFSFYLKNKNLYTTSTSKIVVNGLKCENKLESVSAFEYPKFNRNTRVKIVVPSEEIAVLDPPERPQTQKKSLFMTILPSLIMILMIVLLRGVMSNGGIAYVLLSMGMMAAGLITSVITYFTNKKDEKKDNEKRIKQYNDYIEKKKEQIVNYRNDERSLLNNIYYDENTEIELVNDFSGNLFDRQPEDSDYLAVRLGTGSIQALRKISYKVQEKFKTDDELADIPQEICNSYKMLENAPVVSNFRSLNAIGVVGDKSICYEMMKNMALDISIRHYYKDVKLFFLFNETNIKQFEWIRFLPHVRNEELGIRNIAFDTDSRTILFEYLYRVLTLRASLKGPFEHFVVFAYDIEGIKIHPISKFVEFAASLGVTFVFFGRRKELLPQHCKEILLLNDINNCSKILTDDSTALTNFTFQPIADEVAKHIAIRLAPVYCEEISLENSLTKSISLYELLKIYTTEDLDLETRWNSSAVDKSMAAPLGVKSGYETVYLDLHEKAHGPHGLVAGTTGSGKSEILQSYILSMATLFHPYEVSFMIIDFKGGGMVNQFKNLPHLVGAITNIDGKEIERSLKSIKAELLKRQTCFAEVGVNHIDKYINLYKKGMTKTPIPHLIIIVDEFAELKAEQPEFMKELISASRIGRSLGVHLILATQKPSGQVNEQIWSNSRFKLCLKVQSQEDSNEVIKSPLAAEIKEPGRAYLQVGNNEIFDLFQSGYSGGPEISGEDRQTKEFKIYNVDLAGKKKIVYQQKRKQSNDNNRTQLDAIVEHVSNYCENNNIKKLSPICLPPLPKVIRFISGEKKDAKDGIWALLGKYDDPDRQYQGEVSVNLSESNLFVLGSAQYGKTNVLQTIIRSVSEDYSSKQVNLYILDFGSMVLKNYEHMHHVGGVAISNEEEKLVNLFKLLNGELDYRKQVLAEKGVSSFKAYLEAGFEDIPQIILMIDNVTAFQQIYPELAEELLNLCREGITVGITIVIANSQTAGVGYKYLSNFSSRIALYCNDSGEYSSLFDRTRIEPDSTPGRALIEINHEIKEAQMFLAIEGEREIDRVKAIRAYSEQVNISNPYIAKQIPVVPDVITIDSVAVIDPQLLLNAYRIPYGMNYSNMNIEQLNLLQNGVLGISGRENSGKTNFVMNILSVIQNNVFTHLTNVYIADDMNKRLALAESFGCVQEYTNSVSKTKEIIESIYELLLERKKSVLDGSVELNELLENEPLLLLVISGQDVIDEINADNKIQDKLMMIIKDLRKYKVFVIISGHEDARLPALAPAVMKYIRDSKNLIIFDDISNIGILDIPNKLIKEYSKEITQGDAYTFFGGKVSKIKTILNK